MPELKTPSKVPGLGLPPEQSLLVAADIAIRDVEYLYGVVAPLGSRGVDGRRAIRSLSWPASGVWLRDDHDGAILGESVAVWETPTAVLGLFRLSSDAVIRDRVVRLVREGARLSPGYVMHGDAGPDQVDGTLTEASLVTSPAFRDTVVLGYYSPSLILTLGETGVTESPGPRFAQHALDMQLLDAVGGLPNDDARLAALNALGDQHPSLALASELRSALAAPPIRRFDVSGLELVSVPSTLEVRSAADGTHFLECVCVPYDRVTDRVAQRERFRAGAFAGTRPERVKLRDLNHAKGRLPVGVATSLEERQDGLYGRFRLYRTDGGRSALENVREGVYRGVSVGFHALQDAQVGGVREIRRAELDHVSLVEEPAYEDAIILDVGAA